MVFDQGHRPQGPQKSRGSQEGGTERLLKSRALAASMPNRGRLDFVSYDLDGTLIDGTAFLLVARHFGFEEEVLHHDARFRAGEITLEECFEIEFARLEGRTLQEVEAALEAGSWFPRIRDGVQMLHDAGLRSGVLTDNPEFIARFVKRFGIQDIVSSPAEVKDDRITGKVEPMFDKWASLRAHLDKKGIEAGRVAHIGNDINDVGVWEQVGLGVCVEPTSVKVAQGADIVIEQIHDHKDIAERVLEWHQSNDGPG